MPQIADPAVNDGRVGGQQEVDAALHTPETRSGCQPFSHAESVIADIERAKASVRFDAQIGHINRRFRPFGAIELIAQGKFGIAQVETTQGDFADDVLVALLHHLNPVAPGKRRQPRFDLEPVGKPVTHRNRADHRVAVNVGRLDQAKLQSRDQLDTTKYQPVV